MLLPLHTHLLIPGLQSINPIYSIWELWNVVICGMMQITQAEDKLVFPVREYEAWQKQARVQEYAVKTADLI